jgi:hypothetical protein
VTDRPTEQAEAAIRALTSAYEAAVSAIRSVADRKQAFDAATKLGDVINNLRTETGKFRAELAGDIYQAESLSLAGLAERIGISRARAQDLVEVARTAKKEEQDV